MSILYIWGAGGHGRVVLDCAVCKGHDPSFLDDDPRIHGSFVSGRLVEAPNHAAPGAAFLIAIGNNRLRAQRFLAALEQGLRPATLIHPDAVISPAAEIGEGSIVMPGAIVNAGARIGRNSIVNTGAIVEHDCRVGDHAHIAPRATLGGGVTVQSFVLMGLGSLAIPGVTIGECVTIGAGAAVLRDIAPGLTAVGVPARPLHVPVPSI